MKKPGGLNQEIERLRHQLHTSLGSRYAPASLQKLVPISNELDRLVIQVMKGSQARKSSRSR